MMRTPTPELEVATARSATAESTPGALRRHVVLLNQAFYPDVVSTAQHATDLALALVDAGYDVTVVTSSRAYDDPARRFPRRENYRGIDIVRVGSTSFGKGAKWRRAADFATFMLRCFLRVCFLRRSDVVIALTSPPLISFLGSLMVPVKSRALLFWAMDLNPDEAIAAGWLRERSFAGRLLNALQMRSMRHARRIIALDRFMRDRLVGKGLPAAKISVVAPWAHEPVHYDPAGRDAFRLAHGLDGKFVVMYSGNHSPCHPLDTLFTAAQRLAADPRFVFLFVGGGTEHRRLSAVAQEQRLTNTLFLPYEPLEKVSASLSAADLHAVVMGTPFVGIIHPCKIYNVLRVGAPVLYIGPGSGHIADLASKTNVGFYRADHGDVESVVTHILKAAESPARVREHTALAQQFGHDVLVPQFVREVNAICQDFPAK